MVLPLAADADLVNLYAESLRTDLIAPGRKDTAAALRRINEFLKNETVPGTILFITDGVERGAFPAFSESAGDDARNAILVLGVGTTQGGPLRRASGEFVTENGRRVFSKLDLDGLKALKSEAGIPVSTVTLDDDDINWVERRATTHLQAVQQRGAKVRWIDEGYWLVIPVALLTALWFRKGWTIRWGAAMLFVTLFHTTVEARDFRFMDLWLTPDQQGRYYYEKGDFATAAERFQDPMWKGLALCRKQDYAAALDAFALVDTPESWFNQGNALAYLKKFPEAVHAYEEVLQERPHWREAEDNLALVRALIPPPPKPGDKQLEEAPNLKPDEVKFDLKKNQGKKAQINRGEQTADVWMRNIQTSPADFLRRKFAIESAGEKKK
jgi:Ca-activated chloride channel family protein